MAESATPLRVMLVNDRHDHADLMRRELVAIGYIVVAHVSAGDNLQVAFEGYRPDIIVAEMESPDCDTLEYMRVISDADPRPIVMFTNDDDPFTIRRAVMAGVSAYVTDARSTHRLRPVLDAAIARFDQLQAVRRELQKTRKTLSERKLIEQAKGVLMRKLDIDEPGAYRAMRKMAMDRNLRVADLARSLIAAADLLS